MASTSGSSAAATDFFGWDLLYRTIQGTVNKKTDVLIALAHFILVKQFKMQCLGVGEDKTYSEDDVGSELLPDGWNDTCKRYALRYINNGHLYLLIGHITESFITMNLLDVKETKVSNISLNPDEMVKETKGALTTLIPDAPNLALRFRRELVEPVFAGNTREVTTQTTIVPNANFADPLTIGGPNRPAGSFPLENRPFGFPDIGRSDLDPLGRIGPGNLFPQPSRPDFNSGLNPRFDPFNPNPRHMRTDPNPDHLNPPNFNYDFYM